MTLLNYLVKVSIIKTKKNQDMIENNLKKNVLSEDEQNLLREKFISEYSKSKGWNVKELSPTQMLEIATQKGYKNPGLILG